LQPKGLRNQAILELAMIVAYGTAINQALKNAKTKLEDLKVLRDHATAVLAAQGDLKGALKKLEQEIKSRESVAKKKK
jgi:Domain of unknown function (DUF1843)